MPLPTLTVVSGPPGAGKTTLAHQIAQELGCPAIIRDEIKQGMVDATLGYEPHVGGGERGMPAEGDLGREPPSKASGSSTGRGTGDPLDLRTLKAFFDVLAVLARAGVAVVAEAAFQDRLWRPNLEPLLEHAQIRVIRCTVDATLARDRITHRAAHDTHRAAHADRELLKAITAGEYRLDGFGWIRMDLPMLTVDTTSGYEPGMPDIVAFAAAPIR